MKIACIQMTSGGDPAANVAVIADKMAAACAQGAALVALPETCLFMARGRKAMRALLQPEDSTQGLDALGALAAQHGVNLLIGSAVVAHASGQAVNRSLLIGPDGKVCARYDKIHLFDVTLATGETHAESQSYAAGDRAIVVPLPNAEAKLGMSVCYDLRFPALYRALALGGADILSVPSAFTRVTGEAHWHVLLRARAIETGCFVIAPAQNGQHENGRETYGHSLIVNPWGRVVAEAGPDDDFCLADIDLSEVAAARAQIPALQHARPFKPPA